MIAGIDFTSASTILSGFAIFFAVGILPAAWWFHRKVVKPLSFVLGLKKEDSPSGEEIPSIPVQRAAMRKNQESFKKTQAELQGQVVTLTAEMHPNGGHSMRDAVDKLSVNVIDLDKKLTNHLKEVEDDRSSR